MGLLALLDKIYFNIDDYNENKYCDPKLYKFLLRAKLKVLFFCPKLNINE